MLRSFGKSLVYAQRAYQGFVNEGLLQGVARPWEQVVGQAVLGSDKFLQSVRAKIETENHREIPSRRLLLARPTWEGIQRLVNDIELALESLKTGNRSDPKKAMLLYVAREHGGLSLSDLAKRCGVDESTVSQTAGRVAKQRATSQ